MCSVSIRTAHARAKSGGPPVARPVLTLCFCAALLLGGCPAAGPTDGTDAAGETRELWAAGYRWTWHLTVPAAAEPAPGNPAPVADAMSPPPLVIVLHGSGSDGAAYLYEAGWSEAARQNTFIVAAPDALPADPDRPPHALFNPRLWSAGQPDCPAARAAVDDVALFDALLDAVADVAAFDPQRVYVVGHSGGGSLGFRLAAERPARVSGLAVVAAHCWIEPALLPRYIPTLFIVGTADPLFPLAGGVVRSGWLNRRTPPLAETLRRWEAAIGAAIEVVQLPGQGHRWPGADVPALPAAIVGPTGTDFDATSAIVDFFAAL